MPSAEAGNRGDRTNYFGKRCLLWLLNRNRLQKIARSDAEALS